MTAGSTNGSSTNVVLFERPDIHAFWTAYDPLDMAGESIDPLGFMAGYISLADRILPGFTTITHVPRYLSMLCRALQIALETVGEVQNVTNRRRLVIEKIKLFERAWALSCGLVESWNRHWQPCNGESSRNPRRAALARPARRKR